MLGSNTNSHPSFPIPPTSTLLEDFGVMPKSIGRISVLSFNIHE